MQNKHFNIRPIHKKDNKELARIIRAIFHEFDAPKTGTVYEDSSTDQLSLYFQHENAFGYTAQIKDKVVGCCGIFPTQNLDSDTVELVKFYIEPKARGLGIGKALMSQCIEKAKALGFQKIYLESIAEFNAAIHLYHKFGFEKINQRLGESGHSNCHLWMILEIDDKRS